ncbi:hypothetical protein BC829DRAFT_448934 [Chytridium lagenaria]|nr:hypothetical protein BC829DRAFT_448934 [Chytridium lagenaria]
MTCFTSSSTNSRQQLPLPGPSSRFFKSRLRSILSKRILLASSIYIIALFLFYINLSPSPPHASLSSSIPHLIWTYHEPPPHNTTPSVSIENRIKSWQRYNSISNVTLILPGTLASHISTPTPPNFASLTMRQRTEWVKLAVLLEHGGVWMDTDVVVTENIAGMLEKREACWEKKVKDGETVQLADSYLAAAKVLTVDAGMGVPMPRGLWGRAWGVEEVT